MSENLYINNGWREELIAGNEVDITFNSPRKELDPLELGYVAQYQVIPFKKLEPVSEYKDHVSLQSVHFNHIRVSHQKAGIMTMTFAYIILQLLEQQDDETIYEINTVQVTPDVERIDGELKNVYHRILPKTKQTEKSEAPVRYEVFLPEEKEKNIRYLKSIIGKSKYQIVENDVKSKEIKNNSKRGIRELIQKITNKK